MLTVHVYRAGPAAKDLPADAPEKGEKMIRAFLAM